MPINGTYFAWEDLTVMLPTGPAIDLTEIEHSWDRELEHVYGQGAAPRGVGRGNLKLEGKMTMKREQYNLLLIYAKGAGKSLPRLAPFTITCVYGNEDQGTSTDQLLRVRLKHGAKTMKQGDKTSEVSLDFLFEDLEENGVSITAGLNLL